MIVKADALNGRKGKLLGLALMHILASVGCPDLLSECQLTHTDILASVGCPDLLSECQLTHTDILASVGCPDLLSECQLTHTHNIASVGCPDLLSACQLTHTHNLIQTVPLTVIALQIVCDQVNGLLSSLLKWQRFSLWDIWQ